MSFNPDKCEVLRVTAKQKNITKAEYTIHGKPVNAVSSAKYLGLTIHTKLNYNKHVNNISKKANSSRAFIHRNTGSCPGKVKATAYTSFVRSQLKYASTDWGPHTANNINQIEAVQRRAARSVMNDWSRPHSQSGRSSSSKGSPTFMMQHVGWNTLEVRRNQVRAVMIQIGDATARQTVSLPVVLSHHYLHLSVDDRLHVPPTAPRIFHRPPCHGRRARCEPLLSESYSFSGRADCVSRPSSQPKPP